MTQNSEVIRKYLLGNLDAPGRREIEERVLGDSEFYQELLLAEDEMIDQYLVGQLSLRERESFEVYFLATPERREKLSFARDLNKYIESNVVKRSAQATPKSESSFWQSILVYLRNNVVAAPAIGVALALAVICVFLVVRNDRLQSDLDRLRAESADSLGRTDQMETTARLAELNRRAEQLAEELRQTQRQYVQLQQQQSADAEAAKQTPNKSVLPSVTTPLLILGASRSEGPMQSISVPAGTGLVHTQLKLPLPLYAGYRADLAVDGRVLRSYSLKPTTVAGVALVAVPISARLLPSREYQIRLEGRTRDGRLVQLGAYAFRVKKT